VRPAVVAQDRRCVAEQVAHGSVFERHVDLGTADLPPEASSRLDRQVAGQDLDPVPHHAEVSRSLVGRRCAGDVRAGWPMQQLGAEAIGVDSGALVVAGDPHGGGDGVEDGLELGGPGSGPVLALPQGSLGTLPIRDVPEDDLDGEIPAVGEGRGDDLDVADLPVQPDDLLLQEGDGAAL
jgi:hypothetical protein